MAREIFEGRYIPMRYETESGDFTVLGITEIAGVKFAMLSLERLGDTYAFAVEVTNDTLYDVTDEKLLEEILCARKEFFLFKEGDDDNPISFDVIEEVIFGGRSYALMCPFEQAVGTYEDNIYVFEILSEGDYTVYVPVTDKELETEIREAYVSAIEEA